MYIPLECVNFILFDGGGSQKDECGKSNKINKNIYTWRYIHILTYNCMYIRT